MKVTALAGGVGGAKLLVGLYDILGPNLTAVVNTGDDATIYGVHVSPDVDIVTYWLAGIVDTERGWGISGDTSNFVDALATLGVDTWFRLGDRDLATCFWRTELMRSGAGLSSVTEEVAKALGVAARVIPMSDDPVRTIIGTADGRSLAFQEYFVREKTAPEVTSITYSGSQDAKPGPNVLEAIADAELVVICPSNPVLSIGPILSVPGIREALIGRDRVVAVTPIVQGAALKGPADRILRAMGHEASAQSVASLYRDFCDAFVVDTRDRAEAPSIPVPVTVCDTVMVDRAASVRLARRILEAHA